jgi:hypothetical protein
MTVQGARLALMGAAMVAAVGPLSVERVTGGLRVEASLPRSVYDSNQTVEVALSASNGGGAPLAVTFTSGQRFDLIITRPRGDVVWQWSYGKAFIQVVQSVTLPPGNSLSFKIPWDQHDSQGRRVGPGSYEAVAVFMGTVGPEREIRLPPLEFSIGQR